MLSPLQSPDAVQPPAERGVPPPASLKRVLVRRWGVAVAVALLLHGVVAVIVVLAWRTLPMLNPPGPVIVELAPPSEQPNAQSAEPTFATIGADVGRSESAERTDIDHPFAQSTPKSQAAEGTAESTFAAQSSEPIAPVERADENADARTASGGGGVSAAPSSGLSGGPIDTSIAPPFGAPGKKAPGKLARTLSPLAHPNKQAGGQRPSRRLSGVQGSIVINAIGARVEDPVSAAIARANASGNAIGSTMANNPGSASVNATDSVVTNAIGMAVHVHPTVRQPMNGTPGTGVAASAGPPMPAAGMMNGAGVNSGTGVNGTGMGHLASRASTIGGPAKNASGVLNGTDFHSRHP